MSLVLSALLCIYLSCDNFLGKPKDDEPSRGEKLLETTVDPSSAEAVVEMEGKIRVEIPQNAVPAGTKVTIYRPVDESLNEDESHLFHDIYDVEMSSGSSFTIPLKITLFYDPTKVIEANIPNKIGAAFYNDEWQQWSVYKDVVVDTIANTVSFETYHLTKLSSWTLHGYTDWMSTSHFDIYWMSSGTNAPIANAAYGPKENWYNDQDPYYIQDLASYLEEAYTAFQAKGLRVPTSHTYVYVTDLAGDDGQSSFRGHLYISNNCNGGAVSRIARVALPSACAHELLHNVQDYYYMQLFSQYATKWWLEATAVQADRMVWPTNSTFEALDFANDNMHLIMHRSWDDCLEDPDWYIAGGFLTYLSAFRPGAKADIAQLIIRGGEESVSYFRTIIDTYLINELGSAGIGPEFANYIKWAYEGNGYIDIPDLPPTNSVKFNAETSFFLASNHNKESYTMSLPHLSARIVKVAINEDSNLPSTMKITSANLPDGLKAYLYVDHNFYQELSTGQEAYCTLIKKPLASFHKRYANVLIVNTSKESALEAKLNLEIRKQETNNLSFNEKIYGRALGEHGNNLMVECDASVTGFSPVKIEKIEQSVIDLGDYIICHLIVYLSPGAFFGIIQNLDIEFSEPDETLIDHSDEVPAWKWEWKEFTDGRVGLVNLLTFNWKNWDVSGENSFSVTSTENELYGFSGDEFFFNAKSVYSALETDGQWHDYERYYNLKVIFQPAQ